MTRRPRELGVEQHVTRFLVPLLLRQGAPISSPSFRGMASAAGPSSAPPAPSAGASFARPEPKKPRTGPGPLRPTLPDDVLFDVLRRLDCISLQSLTQANKSGAH